MKIMKKSFSVLLTVLLALSAFAAVASAADENVLLTGTAGTGITVFFPMVLAASRKLKPSASRISAFAKPPLKR